MRPWILVSLAFALDVSAQWMQWGANGRHTGKVGAAGQRIERIETEMVLDQFVDLKKAQGGFLLAHYPAPLVDGNDVVVITRGGEYTGLSNPQSQVWIVTALRRVNGDLVAAWTYSTDWKPVPMNEAGAPPWEPVYHVAMTADAIWAPGAGGTIDKLDRGTGARIQRVNPFGTPVRERIFVSGPPTVDEAGNVFYNAIHFAPAPLAWTADPVNAYLVKVTRDGVSSTVAFSALTPNAPAANAQCTTQFSGAGPFPPAPDAVAPTARCGGQRPGVNVAPAIAPDGTIYTVSRAHFNERWGFLVAANNDLTPKWSSTMRNRFNDGCDVLLPPSGTPGGCSAGSRTGVDPGDNQPGSGRINDLSTSSPVVLPDGNVVYGAQSRYNYVQGHLMMYGPEGQYLRGYEFGWDITPAVYEHDGTYSIILKENRYDLGNRSINTPNDPEQYFITQLSPRFEVEWKFKNTETRTCARDANGGVQCVVDHPRGFEWCVNAVAVDRDGIVYANAEDGYLYAIDQRGQLVSRIFMRLAIGAAYTPLALGNDGRIYTQNDGRLFVIGQNARRRSARR